MDGTMGQREARDRLRPSVSARPPSRASTTTSSTSNAPMTPKSNASASLNLKTSQHTHRYHHSHCASHTAPTRPTSRLSRQASEESRHSKAPASSILLQERLQSQRKESQRSRRMSGDLSASVNDMRDHDAHVHSSPVRRSATATGRRPRSDSGEERADQKGMGIKEMEKTVSTLHKQNFDLKLELFHRRERQTMLEQKTERLEAQNTEALEMQDTLMAELEKRDKAVDEAVAMIMKLETQIEALVREREMAHLVESDDPYRLRIVDRDYESETPTPRNKSFPTHLLDDAKGLHRVPSFLSEHTEDTANLRNVVLGNRSSFFHLRKVSEASAATDESDINRARSPNLSMLSESSFTSVYGTKNSPTSVSSLLPPGLPELSDDKISNSLTPGKKLSKESWGSRKSSGPPNWGPKGSSKGDFGLSSQAQSPNGIIDKKSPLQKLEKLDRELSTHDGADSGRSSRRHPQVKTKQEKREALRKVMTHSPNARDLGHAHALPPTPDTISTSTLRRYQNSNDTLPRDTRLMSRGSFGDNCSNASDISPKPPLHHGDSDPSQPASITACTSRKNVPLPKIDADLFAKFNHYTNLLPPRPRSAGETTIARPRADSWDGWDSDLDSDGGADTSHLDSTFDPWMRESRKPNSRSVSPDLFSFPTDSSGWQIDAMFSGTIRSPVPGLKRDPLDTAVFQPPEPAGKDGVVNPPNRRSSLHATTPGKLRKTPRNDSMNSASKHPNDHPISRMNKIMGGKGRSNSIDSAAVQPPRLHFAQNEKRSLYPPITGQSPSTRGRQGFNWGKGGLNGFFKRDKSGIEAQYTPASATEANFPDKQASPWARPPHMLEDALNSATPPPIMRNRAPTSQTDGHEVDGVSATPNQQQQSYSEDNTPQGGIKKKWLSGLGRRGSIKNRGV